MDTSLRLLDVLNLICIDETNPEFGSDDIFTEFTVDGIDSPRPAAGEIEFDCDNSRRREVLGAVGRQADARLRRELGVRVIEEDDASPNDPSRLPAGAAARPRRDATRRPRHAAGW